MPLSWVRRLWRWFYQWLWIRLDRRRQCVFDWHSQAPTSVVVFAWRLLRVSVVLLVTLVSRIQTKISTAARPVWPHLDDVSGSCEQVATGCCYSICIRLWNWYRTYLKIAFILRKWCQDDSACWWISFSLALFLLCHSPSIILFAHCLHFLFE